MAQPANNLATINSPEEEVDVESTDNNDVRLISVETTMVDQKNAVSVDADADADWNTDADETNRVRRTVQEFCNLHREMHDLRENLVALGAPFQTVGVLVEMGISNRKDEQERLIRSCLASSKVNGKIDSAISDRFRQQLLSLTELERDMALARKLAKQSGFVLPALNALTNIIRANPGDGGHLVVNSFLAYAMAADIKLDQIQEILDKANEEEKSVLPVIEIEQSDPAIIARNALIRDVVLGCCLAAGVMWLII